MLKKSIARKKITEAGVELIKHKHDLLLQYNVDLDNRIVTLSGEIEEGWFEFLDTRISLLESQNQKAILIRLKSQGGSVYEALAVVGRLRSSPCKMIIEGYGEIMSAATLILAAGNRRRMSRFAWFMHHGPSWAIDTTRLADVKDYVRQTERESEAWSQWMAEFTLKDKDFWMAKELDKKDHYFTPQEALACGVVDELI